MRVTWEPEGPGAGGVGSHVSEVRARARGERLVNVSASLLVSMLINLLIGALFVMLAWNEVASVVFELPTISYLQGCYVIMAAEAVCSLPIRDARFVRGFK